MKNPGKRREKLRQYDIMDQTVDISRALDIMAEDISSDNAENEDVFNCDYPDDSNPTKSSMKTISNFKEKWKHRTEFDYKFFDVIREMLKYGMVAFRINEDFSLSKLNPKRIEGYVLDSEDDSKVVAYFYNRSAPYENEAEDQVYSSDNKTDKEEVPVSELLILKIGEGPYGRSVLENVYRTWRQLQLTEDAVAIYRIVRAPERRLFMIDTGRLPPHKAQAKVESFKRQLQQRYVQRNGELETEYNPHSIQEDFFVGVSYDGRSSKIDTLPGGDNMDQIKDLLYWNKKLALGLRIPFSYLGSAYDDGTQKAQYNDGRVGTAYMEELRYAGYILRIQRKVTKALFKHFKRYAHYLEIEVPPDLIFSISPPQSFAIYRENELYNTLMNTVHSAEGIRGLSAKFAIQKFLHLDQEEMAENETMRLIELGKTPEEIKKMEEYEIDRLVYGEPEEDQMLPR